MDRPESVDASRRTSLYRSEQDRTLGGVCAGIAQYIGLDTALVRLGMVVLTVVSAGVGVLAYLLAWVLIPPAPGEPPSTPKRLGDGDEPLDVRAAWNAAGGELRSLVAGLRPSGQPSPAQTPTDAETAGRTPGTQGKRSPLDSVDSAMTALGDRLRDPQVQDDARRAAARVATALNASVDEVNRRARRGPSDPERSDTHSGQSATSSGQ